MVMSLNFPARISIPIPPPRVKRGSFIGSGKFPAPFSTVMRFTQKCWCFERKLLKDVIFGQEDIRKSCILEEKNARGGMRGE